MPSSCMSRRRSRRGGNSLNVPKPVEVEEPTPGQVEEEVAGPVGGRRRKQKKQSKKSKSARKTRKLSKGASEWTQKVVKLYREMKSKDASVRFGDALKRASALKKKGQL